MVQHALAHRVWGHRKISAMLRHDGHLFFDARVLRILCEEGVILAAESQRERRQLGEQAQGRVRYRADRSESGVAAGLLCEVEITTGGWSDAGTTGPMYEPPFHIPPTANAIDAIEVVLTELSQDVRSPAGGGLPGRLGDQGSWPRW